MPQMRERVIDVIRKHPRKRQRLEIDIILPWLAKTTQILQGVTKSVLIDLIQRCTHLKARRDQVIITQGERGDSFYVILCGTVSVFIDSTKTGEEELDDMLGSRSQSLRTGSDIMGLMQQETTITPPGTSELQDTPATNLEKQEAPACSRETTKSPQSTSSKSKVSEEEERVNLRGKKPVDRSKFGKFVIKFGPGRCFGEIALISEDNVRNASIICDEECDFLVVNRDLYNHTLKHYQQQEFAERRHFVNTHPLFKKWNKKFKRLLEMSLIKEVYSFDTTIFKQGDPWNGLVFLMKGKAQVNVEPGKHGTQYKEMHPFIDHDDVYEVEHLKPPGAVEKEKARKRKKKVMQLEQVVVRRKEGYAAAEKRRQLRNINLCAVSEGEIFGDTEIVMGMETYMQTVRCTTETSVYILTAKNCERLINKRNPATMELLKMLVQTKLKSRIESVQGNQIPLFKHLLYRLNMVERTPPKEIPPLRGTKDLPEDEILFDHLLEMFKQQKAELIQPAVPGGIYYREMMKEKAKVRETVKQGELLRGRKGKKELIVRQPPPKRARTVKELKIALNRQNDDADSVEKRMILQQLREVEEEGIIEEFKKIKAEEEAKAKAEEAERKRKEAAEKAKKEQEEREKKEREGRELEEEINAMMRKEVTEEESLDEILKKLPPITPKTPARRAMFSRERTKTFISETGSEPGDLQKAREGTIVENLRDTHSAHGDLDYQDDLPDIGVNNFVVDRQEDTQRPTKKDKARLTFLNAIIRQRLNAAPENPGYRDWETSDRSIRYLEERIRDFTTRTGEAVGQPPPGRLPKLQRFEAGDDEPVQPKPGGKVYVKKSSCLLLNMKQQVTNHQHVRYRMVGRLPEYDRMKRSKMLQHLVLDDRRDKWIHNQSLS